MAALMKRAASSLRRALPDRIDVHLYGGALMLAFGVAGYSRPAGGMIVFGLVLIFIVYRRPE